MKRFVLIFLLLLWPAQVLAEGTQPFVLRGSEGIWFPKDKASKLLQDISILDSTQKALAAQRDLTAALDNKARVLGEAKEMWKEMALKDIREPWYRSSSVLLGLGFVAGALITIGITALQGAH